MSVIRLYEEIVGRGGMSPAHFFYNMTWAEAAAYIRGMDAREKEEWERTRRIMMAVVQPHSKKKLDPEDVLKFTWDKDYVDTRKVDKNELGRIRKLAKKIKL